MSLFACRQCEYPLPASAGADAVCPECGLRQPAGVEARRPSRLAPILLVSLLAQSPFLLTWVALAVARRSARDEAPFLVGLGFVACLLVAAAGVRLIPTHRADRATVAVATLGASATIAVGLSLVSFFIAAVIDGIDC